MKITSEIENKILSLYPEYTIFDISTILKCHPITISKVLKRHDISTKNNTHKHRYSQPQKGQRINHEFYQAHSNRPNYKYNKDNNIPQKPVAIPGTYFTQIRKNARCRNIEFDITVEYIYNILLQQNHKCKLSGIPLIFTRLRNKEDYKNSNASLDRIDSTKGYIPGNVQWVDKRINNMKNKMSEQEFISLCKTVINYQENKT